MSGRDNEQESRAQNEGWKRLFWRRNHRLIRAIKQIGCENLCPTTLSEKSNSEQKCSNWSLIHAINSWIWNQTDTKSNPSNKKNHSTSRDHRLTDSTSVFLVAAGADMWTKTLPGEIGSHAQVAHEEGVIWIEREVSKKNFRTKQEMTRQDATSPQCDNLKIYREDFMFSQNNFHVISWPSHCDKWEMFD